MHQFLYRNQFFGILILLIFISCNNINENDNLTFNQFSKGSGFFLYNYRTSNFNKMLRIYYHIPQNATATTPILMVFHGTNRNASDYRDAFVNTANTKNVIIISPEFSEQNFPRSNQYNLGNVYVNGDIPTSNSLNSEAQWTFSIIEPLFDYIKIQLQNTNTNYTIFGHSAGAQFIHRFLMFKPNNRVNKAVISAAGWYTFPDKTIPFPYGLKNSILENSSVEDFFSKNVFVQVGEFDNNPTDSNLRHNEFSDAQGEHRLERTKNYADFCKQQAETATFEFNWTFHIHKNSDHNYILAAQNAANLLFN